MCEKCPFSIWRVDSYSQPSEHEPPPITTRPGLCKIVTLRIHFPGNLVDWWHPLTKEKYFEKAQCIIHQYGNFTIPDLVSEWVTSVTRKKSPNVSKSCLKMISLEKCKILTPLQKLPKNMGDLYKLIVAKGFKNLPKVQLIAQSGHTAGEWVNRFDRLDIINQSFVPTYLPVWPDLVEFSHFG